MHSPSYDLDIGDHTFPTRKFRLTAELLEADGTLSRSSRVEPEDPPRADLLLVHSADWIDRALAGSLTLEEETLAELPVTAAVARAHALAVSGTVAAARLALESGLGLHCGGGSHHAFPDHGEGFCLFNDLAVAARKLVAERKARRVAVVDLDVHQGNGTAACLAGDPAFFTFSMHQGDLYPFPKVRGSLDVELPAGTGDAAYLRALDEHLPSVVDGFKPDLVLYQAGVDGFERDLLGGLKLTAGGLLRRDEAVFHACLSRRVPVAVTLGGGYAAAVEDTVRLHAQTLRAALAASRRGA